MRFYFTDEDGNEPLTDHIGNIRGARKKAQEYTDKTGKTIYINTTEPDEIIDVIFGQEEYIND